MALPSHEKGCYNSKSAPVISISAPESSISLEHDQNSKSCPNIIVPSCTVTPAVAIIKNSQSCPSRIQDTRYSDELLKALKSKNRDYILQQEQKTLEMAAKIGKRRHTIAILEKHAQERSAKSSTATKIKILRRSTAIIISFGFSRAFAKLDEAAVASAMQALIVAASESLLYSETIVCELKRQALILSKSHGVSIDVSTSKLLDLCMRSGNSPFIQYFPSKKSCAKAIEEFAESFELELSSDNVLGEEHPQQKEVEEEISTRMRNFQRITLAQCVDAKHHSSLVSALECLLKEVAFPNGKGSIQLLGLRFEQYCQKLLKSDADVDSLISKVGELCHQAKTKMTRSERIHHLSVALTAFTLPKKPKSMLEMCFS